MFKPTMNASNNMVQTLASLLERVQIFGPGTEGLDPSQTPLDADSLVLPIEAQYDENSQTVKSALSRPIPFSDKFNSGNDFCKGSLDSFQFDSSLDESPFDGSLESSNFDRAPFLDENFPTFDDSCDFNNAYPEERRERKRNRSRREAVKCLPEISLSEVAQHDMFHDCWMVIYDKVYDVTPFLYEHPGGEDLMMEHAGRDGTLAFRSVGHSKAALNSLQQYIIGVLPEGEKIFNEWEEN